jgi:serine/threonine-protein kinase HipA
MKLLVCLEGRVAGTLQVVGARADFSYSEEWLQTVGAYPLSYSMPLQPTPVTGTLVTNFLWGLLPDNERTLNAWAREFHISARNPAALLAHVGEDCAGAVQFVTEERLPAVLEPSKSPRDVEWLSEEQLAERIRRLAGDAAAGRASAAEGQFSLAGAQSKTALYFDKRSRRWGIPRGRTPTTHILKPAPNDFDGFAPNEHFCLTLARRIDLAAAVTEWKSFGDVPTLVVERYDRVFDSDQRWHRVHQEDSCQALGVHPDSKYEADGGPGFPRVMSLLDATDEPEIDRDRLMRGACFVYLLAATDVHAKNLSLLHARGADRPSMRLAPFYDIASAWPYTRKLQEKKLKLAMRIGTHYRIREILPRHFGDLARGCHYPPERLLTSLREMAQTLPDEAATLAREIGGGADTQATLRAVVDGIARQCASTLRHMP